MSDRNLTAKKEAIRKAFVAVLESPDGDDYQALVDGSHALRALDPSMTIHECAAILTDWAIQDGYFDASDRQFAEEGAENLLKSDAAE